MLGEFIAVAKSAVTCCLSAAARLITKHLRPASETFVAGVVQDVVRSKSELLAENAMLPDWKPKTHTRSWIPAGPTWCTPPGTSPLSRRRLG